MDVQSFDDRDGFIWYNGEFVEWREAKVHVLNHGLHYGSSVFEGIRMYEGKFFKLKEHIQRLHKSSQILGFEIPYSIVEIEQACKKLAEKQNLKDAYIRPVAWRGSEKMKIYGEGITNHLAIAMWQWPGYFNPSLLKDGIKMCWADWKRPSAEMAPTESKAAGLYMICTLSKKKALETGYSDAIMLDYRGNIAEATGANVFLVIDGEIHTPIPDCFLNGITRQTVIGIAKDKGIKVVERYIKPEEFSKAQEVFLTGTAAEITPVGSVGDYKFKPGEVINLLKQEYVKLVRSNDV